MEMLPVIQLAILVLVAILVGVLLVRHQSALSLEPVLEKVAALKSDVERLDRVVREDGEQARTGADERGRLLREEVAKSLAGTRQEIVGTMGQLKAEIGQSLNQATELLRSTLTDLGAAQKERLEGVTIQLHELTKSVEVKLEANRKALQDSLTQLREESASSAAKQREETQKSLMELGSGLRQQTKDASEVQKSVLDAMAGRVDRLAETNAAGLEKVRETLANNMASLQKDNGERLEKMRETVDEKLQGTLEKRLGDSFKLVGEQLEQVHKGLGEMQNLAMGVGDLKKVLSNVKVRGTWGEAQLGNLLAQVFSPEQYHVNVVTKPGGNERVEFAVRFPGRGPEDTELLLPIDAKFPREDYERVIEASERGDAEAVEAASKLLEVRIRGAAKDIRDKYIHPPQTTDFGIMFLPTEGLYAEVLRRPGLADSIQRDCRVLVAGPTNLNALLNSLQMGFRTLAIQRRSSEVWEVLGAVKTEFAKYGGVLDKVQRKLMEASKTVDDVAVRHRAVNRSLRSVSELPESQANSVLKLTTDATSEIEEALEETD